MTDAGWEGRVKDEGWSWRLWEKRLDLDREDAKCNSAPKQRDMLYIPLEMGIDFEGTVDVFLSDPIHF